MKKSLSIEFKINNKNFIPEFLVRFLLLLITLFYFKNQSESISIESSYIIGSLFIVLNFTILLIIINFYYYLRFKYIFDSKIKFFKVSANYFAPSAPILLLLKNM